MTGSVYIKAYAPPPIDKREVLRYLGARDGVNDVSTLVDECIAEAQAAISYKLCYCEADVFSNADTVSLGNIKIKSKALQKNLHDCGRAVIFAATVGIAIDRLIARYCAVSPAKALIFDAIGTERIEALCDVFCDEIQAAAISGGGDIRPRFSPGYGDLPIEAQKDIFAVLDCPRKIGLTLNASMLMSPSKSVTAFIGIAQTKNRS